MTDIMYASVILNAMPGFVYGADIVSGNRSGLSVWDKVFRGHGVKNNVVGFVCLTRTLGGSFPKYCF